MLRWPFFQWSASLSCAQQHTTTLHISTACEDQEWTHLTSSWCQQPLACTWPPTQPPSEPRSWAHIATAKLHWSPHTYTRLALLRYDSWKPVAELIYTISSDSKMVADIHCNPFYIMLLCMHRVQELSKTLCLSVCYVISCPGHWSHFYFIWCCGYILKVGTQQYCSSSWSTVPLTLSEAEIELTVSARMSYHLKKILNNIVKQR